MLPGFIARKRSMYNLPCKDENTLCYAIASQFKKGKPHRGQESYRSMQKTYYRYLKYPVVERDLRQLQDRRGSIINIYTSDDVCGYNRRCLFHTSPIQGLKSIDIFYYDGRFYLIRNFNGFMTGPQRLSGRQFHCRRCLLRFSSDEYRYNHEKNCDAIVVFGLNTENGICPSTLPPHPKLIAIKVKRKRKDVRNTVDNSTMTNTNDWNSNEISQAIEVINEGNQHDLEIRNNDSMAIRNTVMAEMDGNEIAVNTAESISPQPNTRIKLVEYEDSDESE